MWWFPPKKKANKLENKGDKLFHQKRYAKALKAYEGALRLDRCSQQLLDKLIETQQLGSEEWNLEDFTKQMSWTMQKQELDNPRMARVHATLSPEFQEITTLIVDLINATDEEAEEAVIDSIIAYEQEALVPLIEFIRTLKKQDQEQTTDD